MFTLFETARGDFTTALNLTIADLRALRPEMRRAWQAETGLTISEVGGHVVVWGVKTPTVAQRGNA